MSQTSQRARRRAIGAFSGLTLVGLLAAGCGSSGNKAGSTTGSLGTPTTASAPPNVGAAQAAVGAYKLLPTAIPITVPIGKPVPTGKTVAYINCGSPVCSAEGQIVQQADGLLGWQTTIINTNGTPQTVQNAWAQILREKPAGVITEGFPRSEFRTALQQAAADGIAVVDTGTTDTAGNGILYVYASPQQLGTLGSVMAKWDVANSDGSPRAVWVNIPDFPIFDAMTQDFHQTFAQAAPTGSAGQLDIPFAQTATNGPNLIVAYLRAHPGTKYVDLSSDLLAVGLPAALKAAGLSGIQVIGEGPTSVNLQYIASGEESATIAFDDALAMYSLVDTIARHVTGVPLQPAAQFPTYIIEKGNVPTIADVYPVIPDVKGQFAKLWGKS